MRLKEAMLAKSRPLLRGISGGKEVIAVGLALVLTVFDPSVVTAQIVQDPSNRLQLLMVERENSAVSPDPCCGLVVEVRDSRDVPVRGADVTFIAPELGPGPVLFGGARQLTVRTDARGRASSSSMRPDGGAGPFSVAIQAAFQGQTATASA